MIIIYGYLLEIQLKIYICSYKVSNIKSKYFSLSKEGFAAPDNHMQFNSSKFNYFVNNG